MRSLVLRTTSRKKRWDGSASKRGCQYIARIDPFLHRYIAFEELGSGWADTPAEADREALLAIAERHGFPPAAVAYWLDRQPDAFTVLRSSLGEPLAFGCHLALTGFDEEARRADPAAPILDDYLARRGGLATSEQIVVTRSLTPTPGEDPRLRNNTPHLLWLTTPGIVFSFAFLSPAELCSLMTREAFAEAVRDALRHRRQPDALAQSPLAAARCADGGSPEAIARLLDEAVERLGEHPRDLMLQRALVATYFKPAPTQEAAAERLGVPFSSYRRHLTKGVERVVTWLWQRETGRAPS